MQRIPAVDPRLTWRGHISLDIDAAGVRPWRLPLADLPLFHEGLVNAAGQPSGVRLAFATDSRSLVLESAGGRAGVGIGLAIDGKPQGVTQLDGEGRAALALPGGRHAVELWLPHHDALRVAAVQFDDGARIDMPSPAGRRWLTHGSSISHGSGASGPFTTWPARVALERGIDLVNLGFGGQCHLDPLVARLIAGTPADAISIKAGINIYGQASLGPRTFRSNLIAFVRLVREGHPTTPLAVISPVFSPVRETVENRVGLTLQRMREEVAAAVATLREHGDAHLHHLDGLQLLGSDDRRHLPDFLHPDDGGYALIAERFIRHLAPALFA